MGIVGLAGSELLRVFILGAFWTVAEENFKQFHVCMCLYVYTRLGVPDGETVGPLFLLGLTQQQLSSGRHTCLNA